MIIYLDTSGEVRATAKQVRINVEQVSLPSAAGEHSSVFKLRGGHASQAVGS